MGSARTTQWVRVSPTLLVFLWLGCVDDPTGFEPTDGVPSADAVDDSGAASDSGTGSTDIELDTSESDPLCNAVQAAANAHCVGCHSGPEAEAGLVLDAVQAVVGAASSQSALNLIEPYAQQDSYLYLKVTGAHMAAGMGTSMPPPALGDSLTAAELSDLEAWIASGATCGTAPAPDPDPSDAHDATDTGDGTADAADAETDTDDGCSEVQALLSANCTGCHGVFATDGLDLRDVAALVGATSAHSGLPYVLPGDSGGSYLMHKIHGTHLAAGGAGVQMPPGAPLAPADAGIVADWIDAGATCAVPQPVVEPAKVDPNTLSQGDLFQCSGAPSSSEGRLRRIDKHQFRRRIGQNWGHATAANPFEPAGGATYSTYAEGAELDVATLDLYLDLVGYAGDHWGGAAVWQRSSWEARDGQLGCMYDDTSPDATCVETFAQRYLSTAVVFGAPSDEEVARLVDFALGILADEAATGTSRDDSLVMITSAAWLHTSALFESELGTGSPDAFGRRRLSDEEAAAWVASLLSDRGPGAFGVYLYDNDLSGDDRWTETDGGHQAALAAAAADGTIQDPAVAAALVRQYAMGIDPDREDEWIDYGTHSLMGQRRDRAAEWMADKLDRFFIEWFDVAGFESTFQDTPNATTVHHDDNPLWYQRSLDALRTYQGWLEPDGLMVFTDTIAKVVNDDQDVLAKLLTTTEWYLPATNEPNDYKNRIFNINTDIPATRDGRWNTLPATERAGMLTHPVWLSAHGDAFEDGPSIVHRGKWIRENLFCETVPPLELVTVDAVLQPTDGTLTARERVDLTFETQAECMGCHQFMNDLGKPFEFYNHAGMLRADDHGNAPDGSTVVSNAPDPALNGSYATPMAFMTALASSDVVKRCFIRQTFRFFAGRDETTRDGCVLSEMESAYDSSGGSFVSMLEVLATHDAMLYRHNSDEVTP